MLCGHKCQQIYKTYLQLFWKRRSDINCGNHNYSSFPWQVFFFTLLVTPTHKLNKRESKNLVGLMTTTLSKYLGHVLQKKNMMDMLLNNMIDMMSNNLKEWWWKDNYGRMCVLFMQCTKPKFSSNKNKDVTNIITSLNALNIMNTMGKKLISIGQYCYLGLIIYSSLWIM
jgi:hypothetical protein